MYKFTNGIVVFDKETRDNYLKAGFTLEKKEETNEPIEGQISIDEAIEKTIEEENENAKDNSTIGRKHQGSKKISQ